MVLNFCKKKKKCRLGEQRLLSKQSKTITDRENIAKRTTHTTTCSLICHSAALRIWEEMCLTAMMSQWK